MKNFYTLLSLPADAPGDEIKKAFRREIARYHPDKVQHLGAEFQEMASRVAADLTEAYRILMDPALRDRYDEELLGGAARSPAAPTAGPQSSRSATAASSPGPASAEASSTAPAEPAASARPSSQAGVDFVKKASLARLRAAMAEVIGESDPGGAAGFDLAATSRPRRGLFKKAEGTVRLLVRFVPVVDATAVAAVWPQAIRARTADATLCVLLAGPALAPSRDLAAAISEQRRKSRTAAPVLVPVDVRDWEALFPPDTPVLVRSLVQRLKEEKR